MKRAAFFAILVFAVVFTMAFTACDSFFSDSWGTARDYDTSNLDVNAANVNEWINLSVGNPDLAAALVEKITVDLKNPSLNPWDKAALLEGGVRLAVEASGLGTSFLTNAADLLVDMDSDLSKDNVQGIMENVQGDFNKGRGKEAADSLAAMAMTSITINDEGVPRFDNVYAHTASPSGINEAIMVLALGELGDRPIEEWDDVSELSEHLGMKDDTFFVKDKENASQGAIALAAYLNLVNGNSQFEENPFNDFFGS